MTENALPAIKNIGADNAEVFLSTFSEYEEDFVSEVAASNPGVDVHSIHVLSTQYEPQLFSQHTRVKDDAEFWFRKSCRAAQLLGAKYYTFHGPLKLKKSPLNIDMAKFSDRINELTDIASEYRVTICYENIHYGFFSQPDFFFKLAKKCPEIGMCLDIKHAMFSGIDAIEFLDAGGDRVHTVHVIDMANGDTSLPGRGEYDFNKLFKAINNKGIGPAVLIEAYAKNYNEIFELETAYRYLVNQLS